MLLSAVSVLVVAQSSSEIPEGLMNNPVCAVKGYDMVCVCVCTCGRLPLRTTVSECTNFWSQPYLPISYSTPSSNPPIDYRRTRSGQVPDSLPRCSETVCNRHADIISAT